MRRLPNRFTRKPAAPERPTSEERPLEGKLDNTSDKDIGHVPLSSDEWRETARGCVMVLVMGVFIWQCFGTLSHGIRALHQQIGLHAAQLAPHFGAHDTFVTILVLELVAGVVFADKVLAAIKFNSWTTTGHAVLVLLMAAPLTCVASGLVADAIRLWVR